jgi:hypothetical protein
MSSSVRCGEPWSACAPRTVSTNACSNHSWTTCSTTSCAPRNVEVAVAPAYDHVREHTEVAVRLEDVLVGEILSRAVLQEVRSARSVLDADPVDDRVDVRLTLLARVSLLVDEQRVDATRSTAAAARPAGRLAPPETDPPCSARTRPQGTRSCRDHPASVAGVKVQPVMRKRAPQLAIRTHYRYPRLSDRQLDAGVTAGTAAVGALSAVFTPSPSRYLLLVLVLAVVGVMVLQIARRYRRMPSFIGRDHQEAVTRDRLIQQHFTVRPEQYKVSCNYCDWATTDYAHRLVDAPRHLHDEHPSRDPRIPSLLRRRWSVWLGRLVTLG